MQDLVRYRAMESLCRQNAVFRPLESWQLLAEAEMWHHKALEEIASRAVGYSAPTGSLAGTMATRAGTKADGTQGARARALP